jgi:hypothetical protein
VAHKRNTTKVKTGFAIIETTLANCHAALRDERDQGRIVAILKSADRALAAVGGVPAAMAAATDGRQTIRNLLFDLEPKA